MTDPIRKRAEDLSEFIRSQCMVSNEHIQILDMAKCSQVLDAALREQVELDAKIAEKHDCCVIEICDKSYAPSDYCDEAIADAIREQGGKGE